MIHGQSDTDIELLQVLVEQCSSAYEESQLASEVLSHLVEQNLIEEGYQGAEQHAHALAVQTTLTIIAPAHFGGYVKEMLHQCSLLAYALFDVLFETLGQSGYREDEVRLHLAYVDGYVLQGLHG